MNSVHPPPASEEDTVILPHWRCCYETRGPTVQLRGALPEHLYEITSQHRSPYSLLVANASLTRSDTCGGLPVCKSLHAELT